ncbi:MAG: LLM class flavin-dependent oxidoreductase [bacterium]|nr:LLM class flavin-dependent oxidoreductase [bacterium]
MAESSREDVPPEPRTRVGLRFDPRLADGALAGERLAALQEAAPQAEAQGFDVLWIAERPTSEASLVPSALILCAAVAMRTQRLRIASGLLPLPFYHPLRVAEDAASLDGLSAGRFELGVGLGADPAALAHFGVDAEERTARFEEALDLIAAAWRGPLEFDGHFFPTESVDVHPRPIQSGGPPLWIGVEAPAAQRRVAQRDQGLLVRAGVSVEPYLETLAAGQASRVAFLLETGTDVLPGIGGQREIVCCDWILPLAPELAPEAIAPEVERLATRAASLRQRSVG